MGFFTVWGLTLIFVTLKLTNVIAWSWWLVLLPLLPDAIFLILFILGAVLFAKNTK